ncbi:MAG: hypothetical protein PWP64_717 [Candidatus Cloacimonadota bacterium]|nr:hypothetical protein [Candidatus Cloacimonadota bacterium]
MIKNIDVGKDFFVDLVNRDENQGDGQFTAKQFRKKYLSQMDNQEFWINPKNTIVLDFKNVEVLGPSFANEAFAYFTKYAKPEIIKKVIKIVNISKVKMSTIDVELNRSYDRK